MRITPIEIRQKNFEKKLRGYDKDEVNAFLNSLSSEWERVVDESKELKIKLEQSEKEVKKLREVENSLFKTLKTAEDTGANLIDQANKAAELHLKETEMNAEALLIESKAKAKSIIETAEAQARYLIDEMQNAIRDLEKNYQSILSQRDSIIGELSNLSKDIKDRLQRTTQLYKTFKLEDHLGKVRNLVRESEAKINSERLTTQMTKPDAIPQVEGSSEQTKSKLKEFIKSKDQTTTSEDDHRQEKSNDHDTSEDELTGKGSFFDQVGN